jgi:hypothetical protein
MFRNRLLTLAKVTALGSNETIKQAAVADMIGVLSLQTLSLELKSREIVLVDVIGTDRSRLAYRSHDKQVAVTGKSGIPHVPA